MLRCSVRGCAVLLGPRLGESRDVGSMDHELWPRRPHRIEPPAKRQQRPAEHEEMHQRRTEEPRHQRPVAASVDPRASQSRVCDAR